jgi:hypothetical protein
MNKFYQTLTNAWVAECVSRFGHTLPINFISENGCGYKITEGEQPIYALNGERRYKEFKITYNYRSKTYDNYKTAIN